MYQRCTDKARDVIFYAMREADCSGQNAVGSGDILIGLLQDHTHAAAHMLGELGMAPAEIEPSVRERVRPSSSQADSRLDPVDLRSAQELVESIRLAPGGKRILELAWDEAQQLGCTYIGTEHLLIALVSDNRLLPGRILAEQGLDLEMARESAARWLGADTNPPTRIDPVPPRREK